MRAKTNRGEPSFCQANPLLGVQFKVPSSELSKNAKRTDFWKSQDAQDGGTGFCETNPFCLDRRFQDFRLSSGTEVTGRRWNEYYETNPPHRRWAKSDNCAHETPIMNSTKRSHALGAPVQGFGFKVQSGVLRVKIKITKRTHLLMNRRFKIRDLRGVRTASLRFGGEITKRTHYHEMLKE
jgi:hypothetical protein